MNRLALKKNKGQATTELAIMGTIVLMALAYLLQQGYFYNSRQALEMYAFRKALELSRAQERGISLTVSRDVITPSFFSGLSRQRLMASASVEVNPWKVYIPGEDDPQDIARYQLLQINEAMIRDGKFVMIPPTKAKIHPDGEDSKWQWIDSSIREIDPQIPPQGEQQAVPYKNTSNFNYLTSVSENTQSKTVSKDLQTQDAIDRGITFEKREDIINDYNKNSTDSRMEDLEEASIPGPITFTLSESVEREKAVTTPHD